MDSPFIHCRSSMHAPVRAVGLYDIVILDRKHTMRIIVARITLSLFSFLLVCLAMSSDYRDTNIFNNTYLFIIIY